jgi:uncharacterized peroxidase-related enzyme
MPRIAPLTVAAASPVIAATLDAIKTKFGRLPNVYATLAHSPTALHGFLAFRSPEAEGHFDARQREIVALAVGQANRCGYCVSAHTAVGRSVGLNDAQIAAARQGGGLNTKDAALAHFAHAVVDQRGWIDDAALQSFLQAGHSEGEAIEVVALVAMNTLSNYVNHLAGTEVDFPAVDIDGLERAA